MQVCPIDGDVFITVSNVAPYENQGTQFWVNGAASYLTDGLVEVYLQASTNATKGYGNGCMLARSSGVKSDDSPSGQTAGAYINWDPASLDTGQKVWADAVIVDQSIVYTLAPLTTSQIPLAIAIKGGKWTLNQSYLYGPGTPLTDATIVNTAVKAKYVQGLIMTSDGTGPAVYNKIFQL